MNTVEYDIMIIKATQWYTELQSYQVLAFLQGVSLGEGKRLWMLYNSPQFINRGQKETKNDESRVC